MYGVIDSRASLSSVSVLTAAVTEFASTRCLDYATSLVAAPPTSPLAVGGESALRCDALEDRHLSWSSWQPLPLISESCCSPLRETPTPLTFRLIALTLRQCQGLGPLSGELPWTQRWPPTDPQAPASTRLPPPGANVVDGMWIFRVKRPPGSPPVFKARYVARGSTERLRVTLCNAEAEIYAAQELRWLTFLLTDLGEPLSSAPTLFTACTPTNLSQTNTFVLDRG
ncbi:unnamed protein product [Closterium sp. NIES-53]